MLWSSRIDTFDRYRRHCTYNSLYLTPWALKKQVEVVENAKANPSASAITPGNLSPLITAFRTVC